MTGAYEGLQRIKKGDKGLQGVTRNYRGSQGITGGYAPINVKPEGGGPRAYVGHLTFQKIFWSKSPPWGPKTGSNKIKYPHLREVISLKFIVVVLHALQIFKRGIVLVNG